MGDAAFQKRCLTKMGEVATEGRTVLFVSHNMAAVSALCAKGVLIDKGSWRPQDRPSRSFMPISTGRVRFERPHLETQRQEGQWPRSVQKSVHP